MGEYQTSPSRLQGLRPEAEERDSTAETGSFFVLGQWPPLNEMVMGGACKAKRRRGGAKTPRFWAYSLPSGHA